MLDQTYLLALELTYDINSLSVRIPRDEKQNWSAHFGIIISISSP